MLVPLQHAGSMSIYLCLSVCAVGLASHRNMHTPQYGLFKYKTVMDNNVTTWKQPASGLALSNAPIVDDDVVLWWCVRLLFTAAGMADVGRVSARVLPTTVSCRVPLLWCMVCDLLAVCCSLSPFWVPPTNTHRWPRVHPSTLPVSAPVDATWSSQLYLN